MRSRFRIAPLLLMLALAMTACGGSESSPDDASASASASQSEASQTVDRTVTLQPKGNRMKYETTEFSVAPGETVRLVFENTATSPSMQHNVVLLTSNDEALFEEVGEAGTRAGSSNDYVPQEDPLREQVLAYTPMSQPGETVEVTFTVPEESGEHGYLCTFPGHWATMQGTMIVTEDAAA
ncbi:MAG: plastocyanin/azurin family copper-binding protein [Salinibacter sp.]|uniref:plastocyanin/azurin family copper-binding protein n=1 Tax=Salinibacter sp. TaxID=2065818 RepID=UPI002FC39DAC